MMNVEYKITGNKLTIEVDLSKEHGSSKSGKTTVIASTQGNVRLPSGASMGLNVYKPKA